MPGTTTPAGSSVDLTAIDSNIIGDTDSAYTIGNATYGFQSLFLDNTGTDGGAIYFDGGSTSFLKSSDDGTSLAIAGFTELAANAAATTALGSATGGFTDLFLDNSSTDGGQLHFAGANDYTITSTSNTPQTCTFDNTTERVNDTAHGLQNGQKVKLSTTGALPSELSTSTIYYVVGEAANYFQLSLTLGGSAVAFSDDGSGTHSYTIADELVIAGSYCGGITAADSGINLGSTARPFGNLFLDGGTTSNDGQIFFGDSGERVIQSYETLNALYFTGWNTINLSANVALNAGNDFSGFNSVLYRFQRINLDNSTTDGGSIGFNAGNLSTEQDYRIKADLGNQQVCTFTNGTDKVNDTAHELTDDDRIIFSNSGGALPAEISDSTYYYVVNAGADDFQISTSSGGSALDFTDDGTGTNYYQKAHDGLTIAGFKTLDCTSSGIRTEYAEADMGGANPPSDAQLDSDFGLPSEVGSGFTGVFKNTNSGNELVYLVFSDGTNWYYNTPTKAV